MGYRVVTVPADEQGLSGGTVRAAAPELVYMMPSHQFPTGSVMPLGRRLELLAWAAEQEERYLIEDDHDSEYRYRGKPIPSLQSVDGLGKVIYLGTFPKSIAPSLRIKLYGASAAADRALPHRLRILFDDGAAHAAGDSPGVLAGWAF